MAISSVTFSPLHLIRHNNTYLELLLRVLARLHHHLLLLPIHELLLLAIVLHHLLAVHVDHAVHATVHLLLLHHFLLLLHLLLSVFVQHLLLTIILLVGLLADVLVFGAGSGLWRGSLLDRGRFRRWSRLLLLDFFLGSWLFSGCRLALIWLLLLLCFAHISLFELSNSFFSIYESNYLYLNRHLCS